MKNFKIKDLMVSIEPRHALVIDHHQMHAGCDDIKTSCSTGSNDGCDDMRTSCSKASNDDCDDLKTSCSKASNDAIADMDFIMQKDLVGLNDLQIAIADLQNKMHLQNIEEGNMSFN